MNQDEEIVVAQRQALRDAGAATRHQLQALPDDAIECVLDAFALITEPGGSEKSAELITIESIHGTPIGRSRKPGNIVLNWRKLMDIVPDIALAGLGAATLPIAPAWSAVLVALYIWNKVLRGSTEEFSDAEALAMLALWKNRTGMNEISEALGFTKTNELRAEYSLSPLTEGQFNSIVVRFREIRCIELVDGIIRLREWVNVEYP